jgi:isopenicillin N synthase-like dioxygenase
MSGTIPIIDLGGKVHGHSPDEFQRISSSMHQALNQVGFAYIKNCHMDWLETHRLMKLAQEFFRQSVPTKMKIDMGKAGLAWRGYFPVGAEFTASIPDQKEGLYFGIDHPASALAVKDKTPMHGQNQWPPSEEFADFPALVTRHMQKLTELGHFLMESLAVGLGIERDYFSQRFGSDPTVLFRIFNYPAQTKGQDTKDSTWGVGEHTDMGFLTMLLQDELGGLQVHTDSGWIDAPPIPNTFVINIGDMLQHWTHGIYRATRHRVKNISGQDRISLPLFFDPTWQAKLVPIETDLLDAVALKQARERSSYKRWDGLDLQTLNPELTYGDFVWSKIKDVFPNLR